MGKAKPTRGQLVMHLAAGKPASAFARKHRLNERTIRHQASRPDVRRAVEALLREQARQTTAMLSGVGAKAAAELARLAIKGVDERTRLQACTAILKQIVDMSKFSDLESRLADLEAAAANPEKERPYRTQPPQAADDDSPAVITPMVRKYSPPRENMRT